jgi:hypothetical protein
MTSRRSDVLEKGSFSPKCQETDRDTSIRVRVASRFDVPDADCAASISPFCCRAWALLGYEYLMGELHRDESHALPGTDSSCRPSLLS